MNALVVYESMFGNTRAVAEAVAEGLRTVLPTTLVEVTEAAAAELAGLDLLVVGAPTHALGLSRPETRHDAAEKGAHVVSEEKGVREWLAGIGELPMGLKVAAFDTHVKVPMIPGWAGHAAERRLRRAGARVVWKAASFYVGGVTGPLYPGELERARRWGEELGAVVCGTVAV